MKTTALIVLAVIATGCSALSQSVPGDRTRDELLAEARASLEYGEFYRARTMAEEALEQDPWDEEASHLMAEILEAEIAQQKEVFEVKAPEEFTSEERKRETKTWLERSEALKEAEQYGEAMEAAEKVFIYDADNERASALLDEIRAKAIAEGKAERIVVKRMYQDEIHERVERYKVEARRWLDDGRWGAAKLALEKVLLLEPSDREAASLYEDLLKTHQGAAT